MSRILFFSLVWFGLTLARAGGADFEVTTTNDSGAGSYRQAIEDANDNPGPDRIIFNIPGNGVQTIRPLTRLPACKEPIVVDGYTQPGARANTLSNGIDAVLLIHLDGVDLTGTNRSAAVRLSGGSSTLRGLVITRFTAAPAVWLDSSSNRVTGNFVGTDPSGLNPLGNSDAFWFQRVSSTNPPAFDSTYLLPSCCNVVGGTDPADRNLISGNAGYVFYIGEYDSPLRPVLPPVSDSAVLGNFIGTDATGLARIPGGLGTMFTIRSAVNLTIGGLEPGAGNVIALSDRTVHLYGPAENTRILGNYFGVGVDGRTSIGRTNSTYTISREGRRTYLEANRIAYGSIGVANYTAQSTLTRNLIYSNLTTGISGFPPDTIEFSATSTTTLELAGRLRGLSNALYKVEFFGNTAPHSSGYGEGESYLGSTLLTTGPNGEGAFQASFPHPDPWWPWISFTATAPDGTTSGFSLTQPVRSSTLLQIYRQPAGFTARPGTNATLRVDASGAAPIHYQWRRKGVDVPGATDAVLSLPNLQPGQDGTFTVFLSNPLGTLLSEPAQVTLLVTPTFVRQPITQTVAPGEWVTLSAVVNEFATRPISFGWRSNNVFIAATSPGPDTTTYLTVRAGTVNAIYRVTATNAAAPTGFNSDLAQIVVDADRDQDGLPDAYETANRLDPDNPADAAIDTDGDGVPNGKEYIAGTDPQNPFSVLQIERTLTGPDGTLLQFRAARKKTYSIHYREQLGESPWLTLTNLPASPTNMTAVVLDAAPVGQRFYRLVTPFFPQDER